jgi:chromosome segregation ATPase
MVELDIQRRKEELKDGRFDIITTVKETVTKEEYKNSIEKLKKQIEQFESSKKGLERSIEDYKKKIDELLNKKKAHMAILRKFLQDDEIRGIFRLKEQLTRFEEGLKDVKKKLERNKLDLESLEGMEEPGSTEESGKEE